MIRVERLRRTQATSSRQKRTDRGLLLVAPRDVEQRLPVLELEALVRFPPIAQHAKACHAVHGIGSPLDRDLFRLQRISCEFGDSLGVVIRNREQDVLFRVELVLEARHLVRMIARAPQAAHDDRAAIFRFHLTRETGAAAADSNGAWGSVFGSLQRETLKTPLVSYRPLAPKC